MYMCSSAPRALLRAAIAFASASENSPVFTVQLMTRFYVKPEFRNVLASWLEYQN
jgi:hypothetical protein